MTEDYEKWLAELDGLGCQDARHHPHSCLCQPYQMALDATTPENVEGP